MARSDIFLKQEGLESISDKLNQFGKISFLIGQNCCHQKMKRENNIINILNQLIWLNFDIKRNGIFCIIGKYCYNDIFFINDIMYEDKNSFV